ncbi:MAG: tetratricopeptide repeat protein [Pyrinomonadaceae bacterium]
MLKELVLLPQVKRFVMIICATALSISALSMKARSQNAAHLLKEGVSYQNADDTSDRAADLYRQLIRRYPTSAQAEQAQFFLGTYYQKKFFLLEGKSKVQDWSSFNQAEQALYGYVGAYTTKGTKSYLADSYHMLAVIALRRGYPDTARTLLNKMIGVATKDRQVYINKVVWSARADDVIKGYCDTTALASASLDAIKSGKSFTEIVSTLNNWCRGHCR